MEVLTQDKPSQKKFVKDMSVMILDAETNKQITVCAGETNSRKAPMLSGSGRSQDPLKFIEDFEKAARWNNWLTDDRKKETF